MELSLAKKATELAGHFSTMQRVLSGGHMEPVSDRQRPPRKQNFNGELKEKEGEAGKDEGKEPSTMGKEHTRRLIQRAGACGPHEESEKGVW